MSSCPLGYEKGEGIKKSPFSSDKADAERNCTLGYSKSGSVCPLGYTARSFRFEKKKNDDSVKASSSLIKSGKCPFGYDEEKTVDKTKCPFGKCPKAAQCSARCPLGYDKASAMPRCPLGYEKDCSAAGKCPFGYDKNSKPDFSKCPLGKCPKAAQCTAKCPLGFPKTNLESRDKYALGFSKSGSSKCVLGFGYNSDVEEKLELDTIPGENQTLLNENSLEKAEKPILVDEILKKENENNEAIVEN